MHVEFDDVSEAESSAPDDKAPRSHNEIIDALHPGSTEAECWEAAVAINKAGLIPLAEVSAVARMAEKLGFRRTKPISDLVKKAARVCAENALKAKMTDETKLAGKSVFRYKREYHFHDAIDKCVDTILRENEALKLPFYSCIGRQPVMLQDRNEDGRNGFTLEPMSKPTFSAHLSQMLTFVEVTDQGDDGARRMVPREVSEHVYEVAEENLPQAPEIAYTPLFLRDGKLISEPGYHFDAENPHYLNILMIDSILKVPPVSDEPSVEDMEAAMAWIRLELLSDFPFCEFDVDGNGKREPSEANALAMILTPFMRRMIHGRTPVFFIDKPTPGTGGTILGQLPMWLYDGEPGSVTRYSQNPEEMQKGLIAAVQSRRSHLFFDDVSEFNNRELLRAITQTNISGRLLGSNSEVCVPNRFNWVGTGNNTIIHDEMARRTVFIRLNALIDDLSKRKYRHPDTTGMTFERFLESNRGIAVRHILTCIQYWISTGCIPFTERRRSSFEDWSAKVGGVLQACGIRGFLEEVTPRGTDKNSTVYRSFFRMFHQKYGIDKALRASEIFDWASAAQHEIITGNTDDQKRSRFTKHTLYMLHGKTYRIDEVNLMMMRTFDKNGDMTYMLVKVKDEMKMAVSVEVGENGSKVT